MAKGLNIKDIIAVTVVSYNAEKTIIETLDSILNQTYGSINIELIIADDFSLDSTRQVITKWVEEYSKFFACCEVILNKQNLGVTRNINNAWMAVIKSNWVKTIAADDILDSNCLQMLFKYVEGNSECKVVFSNAYRFKNDITNVYNDNRYIRSFYTLSPQKQYQELLLNNCLFAATSFISINLLKSIDYADERFPMIEDLPLWLKITKKGIKLHGIDKNTVYYRLDDSISHNLTKIVNVDYLNSKKQMYKLLIWPELSLKYILLTWDKKIELFILDMGLSLFNNKRTKYFTIFSKVIRICSPVYFYKKIISLAQYK